MADDAGSRRPSQPSTPVSPAGVGASASNRGSPRAMVSPSILQEILESGDQPLIDDALEQWDPAAMGQLLSTLPSPVRASPAGVGSAASNRSSPSPAAAAVPQTPAGAAAVTAGVGAGGSGGSSGGSSSSSSSRSRRSSPASGRVSGRSGTPPSPAPVPRPWQPVPHEDDLDKVKKNPGDVDAAEEEDEDVRPVPTRRPPCRGRPPVAPNKAPLKHLSIKPICNDGCACCFKTKNKLRQDDALPTSPPPTAS